MRVQSRSFVAVLLLFLLTISGQAAGVLLQGRVVDPAGSPLPGATVELVSASRVVAKAVTGSSGQFRLPDVAQGTYELRVTLTGFRQSIVALNVGSSAPQPLVVRLLIGSVEEKVIVQAAAPTFDFMPPFAAPVPPSAVAAPGPGDVSSRT